MKLTKKFLKQWGINPQSAFADRAEQLQMGLNGGLPIERCGQNVSVFFENGWATCQLETPAKAVKFAAALNKLRRPLRLIKQDLDKDWAQRVKERDDFTCAICGVKGDKQNVNGKGKDVLTAHHWYKTKARSGMARWARANGATVHFAEHIHSLHENPCWMDLEVIYYHVIGREDCETINALRKLVAIEPTEALVRKLWLERIGSKPK